MMYPQIENLKHTDSNTFFLMAGPCVIEGEAMAMHIAETIVKITDKWKIPYIFKGSYRKANRSRFDSFTGIGDEKALLILRKVRESFDIPVVTDIHSAEEAVMAAEYVDILQIPAFLCRQTDLLIAAARTGKIVNIKKGQFLSPEAMQFAAGKVVESGNHQVMLTERGTTFGYQDLIVDYRARLIETMARAGIAVGVDGLFMETHPEPSKAKSDGANMLPLHRLDALLGRLVALRQVVNTFHGI